MFCNQKLFFRICWSVAWMLVFGASLLVVASEESGQAGGSNKSGGHEAAAESGGEHGSGEKDSGEAKPKIAPWAETEAKLAELSAKVANKKSVIEQLIAEKNHLAPNSPQLKEVVQQIVKEHKSLKQLIEDYEKNRNILKYRFPERGNLEERKYQKLELKSVEELEKAIGVDGKLNRNMAKIKKVYKTKTLTTTTTTLPSSHADDPTIESTRPIILNK